MGIKRVFGFVLTTFFIFVCDTLTKYWAILLPLNTQSQSIYPYGGLGIFQNFLGIDFCINRVANFGGAWGIFASYPKILLVTRLVIIFFGFLYALFINKDRKKDLAFLLIFVGAICNILNCFTYGAVIDMFHFNLWGYSFPVFNVADISIFFGVVTLFFQPVLQKIKKQKKYEAQSS